MALGWEQVKRLHPGIAVLAAAEVPLTDDLVEAALRGAPTAWSWETIRQQAAEGTWGADLMDPATADWMDEGMFSRWAMGDTRTTESLLGECVPGLSVSALRCLRRAIEGRTIR